MEKEELARIFKAMADCYWTLFDFYKKDGKEDDIDATRVISQHFAYDTAFRMLTDERYAERMREIFIEGKVDVDED